MTQWVDGQRTLLRYETFATSRQPNHYDSDTSIFDLNSFAISLLVIGDHLEKIVLFLGCMDDYEF